MYLYMHWIHPKALFTTHTIQCTLTMWISFIHHLTMNGSNTEQRTTQKKPHFKNSIAKCTHADNGTSIWLNKIFFCLNKRKNGIKYCKNKSDFVYLKLQIILCVRVAFLVCRLLQSLHLYVHQFTMGILSNGTAQRDKFRIYLFLFLFFVWKIVLHTENWLHARVCGKQTMHTERYRKPKYEPN